MTVIISKMTCNTLIHVYCHHYEGSINDKLLYNLVSARSSYVSHDDCICMITDPCNIQKNLLQIKKLLMQYYCYIKYVSSLCVHP